MPAVSVSIRTKTLYDLETAAERTGRNKSSITDEALTKYLAELLEDADDAKAGEEAYARFKASGEKAIPAERVYEELGL